MNFSRNKIFNLKICRIKPFISGFGPTPIEHGAKTGQLHCLLHSFSCERNTHFKKKIITYGSNVSKCFIMGLNGLECVSLNSNLKILQKFVFDCDCDCDIAG